MTLILLYLKLIGASLCGMLMQLLSKSSDMELTSQKANLIYEGFVPFLKRDWKAITVNALTIVVTFLIFNGMVNAGDSFFKGKTYNIAGVFDVPLQYIWSAFVVLFFFSTGYFGQDFILRRVVKSVQSKLIKEAIDYKTTIADTASGTLDKPTPIK